MRIELRSAEFKSDVVNKGMGEGIILIIVLIIYLIIKEGGSKLIISSLHTYCMIPKY